MKTTTTVPSVADLLRPYGACDDAIEWASNYTCRETAWLECPRAYWLLWIITQATDVGGPWSNKRKSLVACCLDCASVVAHMWPQDQATKIADAVAVMRQWIAGKATVERAQQAHNDLWDGAAKVPYSANSAAANAAYAAIASAAHAAHVAYIVDVAANNAAAYAADGDAIAAQNLADIVRRHYPKAP